METNATFSSFSKVSIFSDMSSLFSNESTFITWRRLWIALAEAQKELGLPIKIEQIKELKIQVENLHETLFKIEEKTEENLVLAHLKAFGEKCPSARTILHLGASSTFISDNTLLMQMHKGLGLILSKLVPFILSLSRIAEKYHNLPCLGSFQEYPYFLTTVGKRISLWLQDFFMDLKQVEYRLSQFQFLGIKGPIGAQNTLGRLFKNNHKKIKLLEQKIGEKMGFSHLFSLTGHTYPQKQDTFILQTLNGIAFSSLKLANDLRFLLKDQEVSFSQIEGLAPFSLLEAFSSHASSVFSSTQNSYFSTNWLENSDETSFYKHKKIKNAFISSDQLLTKALEMISHLAFETYTIQRKIEEYIPFIALESILEKSVEKGADLQNLHPRVRLYMQTALQSLQRNGPPNTLKNLIEEDLEFLLSKEEIEDLLISSLYIGQCPEQVLHFLNYEVKPFLNKYQNLPHFYS